MEIKSNNILIGAFALAAIAAFFLFALWIGRVQLDRTYTYFEIVFSGSVSGLTESGVVQYNGIPVGRVVDLHLAEDDPSKVVALIELDARTPVKEDTHAQLELFGLTGVALIELTGGSAASPRLTPKAGQAYPTIVAAPSAFQELFASAPDTIQNANALVSDVRVLVRENQKSIRQIVSNLESLSADLAGSSSNISGTLENINVITSDVAAASGKLESMAGRADDLLATDVSDLVREAKLAAVSYRKIADELESVLAGNRGAINGFARDGLGQLPLLIEEARDMVSSLDRFISRAEGDPARFLLGRDAPEYDPE
jgi:phospholipid/cholesterol/gamma-HCH transport system substrate-binding protein